MEDKCLSWCEFMGEFRKKNVFSLAKYQMKAVVLIWPSGRRKSYLIWLFRCSHSEQNHIIVAWIHFSEFFFQQRVLQTCNCESICHRINMDFITLHNHIVTIIYHITFHRFSCPFLVPLLAESISDFQHAVHVFYQAALQLFRQGPFGHTTHFMKFIFKFANA